MVDPTTSGLQARLFHWRLRYVALLRADDAPNRHALWCHGHIDTLLRQVVVTLDR